MLLIAVQFQQLLPHGERRPVSRTAFRVCPQQAEVLEAEGLKAREFPWAAGHPTPHPIPAARLQQTGKSSGGSVRRGLAGADGRKPGLYVRLGIAVFQAVQTDIPFPTGGKDSGVLDPGAGFYPIPHPPQLAEEGLVGVGLPDGLVHVLTDQVPHGGLTLRLDAAHYARLTETARTAGLKIEPMLRQLIMGVNLRPRPPDTYAALLRELNAIGNNVNQLAYQANARGAATQDEIREAARLVRQAVRLVRDTL